MEVMMALAAEEEEEEVTPLASQQGCQMCAGYWIQDIKYIY